MMGIIADIDTFLCMYSEEGDQVDPAIAEYISLLIQDEGNADSIVDVIQNFIPSAPVEKIQELIQQRGQKVDHREKDDDIKIILTNNSKGTTVLDELLHESLRRPSSEEDKFAKIDRDQIDFLTGLSPHLPQDFIRHILRAKFSNDYEGAAQYLLETPSEEIQAELQLYCKSVEEAERERQTKHEIDHQVRRTVVDRYGDQVVRASTTSQRSKTKLKPRKTKKPDPESLIRYYDGKVVSRKGEKYVPETPKEEWDGGSRGRVKTKGKRGKGWTS